MMLSDTELTVLTDREIYLAKRSLNEKLDALLAGVQRTLLPNTAKWVLPVEGIDRTRGKIFRGENHRGFPYVLLDFPRQFSAESVFAVRTMCWYGNEFSVTLHLQGAALQPYMQELSGRVDRIRGNGCYWCVNDTPWEYGFGVDNYLPLDEINRERIGEETARRGFLKLSRRLPLTQHEQLEKFALETIVLFGDFLES